MGLAWVLKINTTELYAYTADINAWEKINHRATMSELICAYNFMILPAIRSLFTHQIFSDFTPVTNVVRNLIGLKFDADPKPLTSKYPGLGSQD